MKGLPKGEMLLRAKKATRNSRVGANYDHLRADRLKQLEKEEQEEIRRINDK